MRGNTGENIDAQVDQVVKKILAASSAPVLIDNPAADKSPVKKSQVKKSRAKKTRINRSK
jgi:hypothetical protein